MVVVEGEEGGGAGAEGIRRSGWEGGWEEGQRKTDGTERSVFSFLLKWGRCDAKDSPGVLAGPRQ